MYRPPHLRPNEHGINLTTTTVDASEPSQTTDSREESPAQRDYHTCQECPRHIPHDTAECPIYKKAREKQKPTAPTPSQAVLKAGIPQTEETPNTEELEESPLGLEDDSFQEPEQDIPSRIEELRFLIRNKYEDDQVTSTIELMKECAQSDLPKEA